MSELDVKSLERLLASVKAKYERQVKALADTKLQVDGAEKALESAKKVK